MAVRMLELWSHGMRLLDSDRAQELDALASAVQATSATARDASLVQRDLNRG